MATAIPIIMLAATAASAGAAIYTGVEQSNAQRAQARAANQNAEFYKELGERNAQAAITDAKAEEARYRRTAAVELARFQSRLSARGTDMSGTPLAILGDASASIEENALLIRHSGRVAAQNARLGLGVESRNQAFQAQLYQSAAGQSLLGGFGDAIGYGASGVGQAYQYGWRPGPGNNIYA